MIMACWDLYISNHGRLDWSLYIFDNLETANLTFRKLGSLKTKDQCSTICSNVLKCQTAGGIGSFRKTADENLLQHCNIEYGPPTLSPALMNQKGSAIHTKWSTSSGDSFLFLSLTKKSRQISVSAKAPSDEGESLKSVLQ